MLALLGGLLVGPGIPPVDAQVPDWSFEARVFGQPQGPHAPLPTGRATGPGTFYMQFLASITCPTSSGGYRQVVGLLESAHLLAYAGDNDLADGSGTFTATDASRRYLDLNAVETGTDTTLSLANVSMQVVDGEFARVGPVFVVELTLDISVERDPDGVPGSGDELPQCTNSALPVTITYVPSLVMSPDFDSSWLEGVARDTLPL